MAWPLKLVAENGAGSNVAIYSSWGETVSLLVRVKCGIRREFSSVQKSASEVQWPGLDSRRYQIF
jgi:hypothetical protein